MSSITSQNFSLRDSTNNYKNREGSQSSNSSMTTTPTQTPTQELSTSIMTSSLISQPTSTDPSPSSPRGRPRYKRRQPSRRYYTPPSRLPSPARPDTAVTMTVNMDFMLEVESAPQDPDIFADAETDYFSSAERADGPRAFRRHFFDALSSVSGDVGKPPGEAGATGVSIDAILAGSSGR